MIPPYNKTLFSKFINKIWFDKYFEHLYNILNKTTGTIAETYPFLV